jgi:hypothetical protein
MHAGWIIQIISLNPKAAKDCAAKCLGYDKQTQKSKFADTYDAIIAKEEKDTTSYEAILLIVDTLVNIDNREVVLDRFQKLDKFFTDVTDPNNEKPRPILAWHIFSTMVEAYQVTEEKLKMMDRMRTLAMREHTKDSYLMTRLLM